MACELGEGEQVEGGRRRRATPRSVGMSELLLVCWEGSQVGSEPGCKRAGK